MSKAERAPGKDRQKATNRFIASPFILKRIYNTSSFSRCPTLFFQCGDGVTQDGHTNCLPCPIPLFQALIILFMSTAPRLVVTRMLICPFLRPTQKKIFLWNHPTPHKFVPSPLEHRAAVNRLGQFQPVQRHRRAHQRGKVFASVVVRAVIFQTSGVRRFYRSRCRPGKR